VAAAGDAAVLAGRLAALGIALVFALASASAAGAGYAWVTNPYASELATLRSRAEFDSFVDRRLLTMTAAERRQFDALMKRKTESNR